MNMAAARPQLVVSAGLITFAQNVRATGWTEGKTVLLFMIMWLQLRRHALFVLLGSDLAGWANREQQWIFWNGTQNMKSYMIPWREIYQLVIFFSYFSSDWHSKRSILSSLHSLPYLQRQFLHAFAHIFWMVIANYNFCCSTLSWMGKMTCGLHCGPRDVGNSYRSSTCLWVQIHT